MAEPEPDWYPDPGKTPGVFRWWTGAEWTDLLASDPDAPPPSADAATRSVRPSGQTLRGHALRNTLVIAAVLAAVLTLFTVIGFQPAVATRYPEGRPSDFGTPKVLAPEVSLDEQPRTASVRGRMTATLPGKPFSEPYVRTSDPTGPFSDVVGIAAPVHKDSDGTPRWHATAFLGLVRPDLVTDGDLLATAASVEAAIEWLYGDIPVEVGDLTPMENLAEGLEGFHGKVSYDVAGMPSTHDRVVVILSALEDGEVGAWMEFFPNEAPTDVQAALEEARGTLQPN